MKIIIIIKNLWNGIRMLLLIRKIFKIEDFLSNLFNEIILNNIGEDTDTVSKEEVKEEVKEEAKAKAKEEYNKEIYKNSLMLKFIGAITFIC